MRLADGVRVGPYCVLRDVDRRPRHDDRAVLAPRGRRDRRPARASARSRGCAPARRSATRCTSATSSRSRRARSDAAPRPTTSPTSATPTVGERRQLRRRLDHRQLRRREQAPHGDRRRRAHRLELRAGRAGAHRRRRDDRRRQHASSTTCPPATLARRPRAPGRRFPGGSVRASHPSSPDGRKAAEAMCGIVGAVASRRRPHPDRRHPPPRVPRLRFDRPRGDQRRRHPALERLCSTARVAELAAQADAQRLHGTTGISHTRWATHGAPTGPTRIRTCRAARSPWCTTASSRTTRSCATRLRAQGYAFRHADRHRGDRAPRALALARRGRRRPARARCGCAIAEFHGAYAIAVDLDARAGPRGRRARRAARWWSASARARISSRPTPRRCCRSRAAWSTSRKATSPTCAATAYAIYDAHGRSARSARSSTVAGGTTRWSSARTGTSCRRRSSSSRAPSPTRSRAVGGDRRPKLFGADGRGRAAAASSRC